MDLDDDVALRELLEAIFDRFHYDFRDYSIASVRRRLGQALTAFGCASLAELQGRVLTEPTAFPMLLRYLTVQVSDLFRDPPFWRAFREQVVPHLHTYPSLKVWIAGCATGEEVYSFAILLHEEGLLDRTILYATDINEEALRVAEAGIYSRDRLPAFEKNHELSGAKTPLTEHFTAKYGSLVFDRRLRRNAVFSDHSLATDSVFAEVQVVSCRNVLIYFDPPLQDRAVGLFRDALCMRGFLGLGAKERLKLTRHEAAFEIFADDERWYRRG